MNVKCAKDHIEQINNLCKQTDEDTIFANIVCTEKITKPYKAEF